MKYYAVSCLVSLIVIAACSSKSQLPYDEKKMDQLSASIPEKTCPAFDPKYASELARLSLGCVDHEYPNKHGHIYESDESLKPARTTNPAFFGCFDWHSSVHGHWAMARILKTFPNAPVAAEIRQKLNAHLTRENIAAEVDFFKGKMNATFERTYGWAWLLRLYDELYSWNDPDAMKWRENLLPLAVLISSRTAEYLPKLSAPIRVGTHTNLAFAMSHMLDYAKTAGDEKLETVIKTKARDFYFNDKHCPVAYEPSGEDFVSPCMAEADLMRRVLSKEDFVKWLNDFLPPLYSQEFAGLIKPIEVKDKKDYAIGHLIGLGFNRAWTMKGIAGALPESDKRKAVFEKIAGLHCDNAMSDMKESGYGGTHWLASFALFAASQ